MKRTLILASAGLVALVSAGLAVANGIEGAKSAKAVAGGFATGTPSQFRTRSCTTSDGKTLVATEGVYTGTATGATAGDAGQGALAHQLDRRHRRRVGDVADRRRIRR